MVVVFLHIDSESVDFGWLSFPLGVSLLSEHHCWQPQKFSLFCDIWVEVAMPIKDHMKMYDNMNHCISVVASNYSQSPELCALIHYTYHLMSYLKPPPSKKHKMWIFSATKHSSLV